MSRRYAVAVVYNQATQSGGVRAKQTVITVRASAPDIAEWEAKLQCEARIKRMAANGNSRALPLDQACVQVVSPAADLENGEHPYPDRRRRAERKAAARARQLASMDVVDALMALKAVTHEYEQAIGAVSNEQERVDATEDGSDEHTQAKRDLRAAQKAAKKLEFNVMRAQSAYDVVERRVRGEIYGATLASLAEQKGA